MVGGCGWWLAAIEWLDAYYDIAEWTLSETLSFVDSDRRLSPPTRCSPLPGVDQRRASAGL